MRVLPRLTIDKILLVSALLSLVYLLLHGVVPPDHDYSKPSAKSAGMHHHKSAHGHSRGRSEHDHDGTAHRHGRSSSIKYSDIVLYDDEEVKTCPRDVRLRHLRENCQTSPAKSYTYGQGDRQLIRYAVVDDERKLFYCLVGKAGSKSWLKYLVESRHHKHTGHLRHNTFLSTVGLKMLRNIELEKVKKLYGNYFKFLVVRHPLQRTVSAYYETVVLHQKYRNPHGDLLNFTEYATAITGKLMDENPHWRRYINRCKVCKLDYDYVVKTETMADDIKSFNRAIGNNEGPMVQYTHQNQFLQQANANGDSTMLEQSPDDIHHYKYDKTLYSLQQQHPNLMRKLINVYAEDMHLFGYKWDWTKGTSSCSLTDSQTGRECC